MGKRKSTLVRNYENTVVRKRKLDRTGLPWYDNGSSKRMEENFMRGFIATLSVIVILMIAFMVFFFIGGTLTPTLTVSTVPASEQEDAFDSACAVIEQGLAFQTFSSAPEGSADDYRLTTAVVTLKNRGLFPAEWVEIEITPAEGDAAAYSVTGVGMDIPRFARGQFEIKLLTSAPETDTRTALIRYYVLGMRRSIRIEF